jgi:photosystem II stability/assembly factor-like uncharacterized protein
LAISPHDDRAAAVSGEQRVYSSRDGGRSWSAVASPAAGLLVWTRGGVLLLDFDGRVWQAADLDGSWRQTGEVGGQPAAFESGAEGELLVALHDGTIKRSTDAGRSWTVRAQP